MGILRGSDTGSGVFWLAAIALLSLVIGSGCQTAPTPGSRAIKSTTRDIPIATTCLVTSRDGTTKRVDLNKSDTRSVTFAIYGDNRDDPATFRRLLSQVNASQPLFAIDNGDLVGNGSEAEYRDFAAMITAAQQPLFMTAGNHDVQGNGASIYMSYFGLSDYWFDWAGVRFVFLDSSGWTIGSDRLAWCDSVLTARGTKPAIVITHVPPFDPRPGQSHSLTSADDASAFMDLMTRQHVLRVYASHIHGYYTAERGGVAYVITGGAGAPLVDAGGFFHFVLVTVANGKVKESVVRVGP